MNEEIDLYLEDSEERMQEAIRHLEKSLLKIRAGKASPGMLGAVVVDYYGTMTPLAQVASIGTSDARTIVIQPWEKGMIQPIEKAILNANLGFNPNNNGESIHVNVPVLTEERRRDLAKQVRAEGEDTKVSIRNARRDANDGFKQLQKDGASEDQIKRAEDEVQKMTDKYSIAVDKLLDEKQNEILKV